MNVLSRDLISFMVVACGVCVGAWVVFVQPKMSELRALEAEIRQFDAPASASDQASIELMAKRAAELRERLNAIEQANTLGNDSTHLYNVMTDLAREQSVRVLSLQPGARQANEELMTARRVTMSVEGTYQQIASFILAVNEMPDYVRPHSLVLLPRHGVEQREIVLANLAWDVLTFTFPEELAFLQGTTHAQP
jgi:Tfp pilus assembly protein PilO